MKGCRAVRLGGIDEATRGLSRDLQTQLPSGGENDLLHVKLRRVALAGTLVGTLVVPAVVSFAGPNDQIEKNNQELEVLQNRIDHNTAEKQSLQGEINVLNENITELQMAINKLDANIADIEAEIRTVEAKIADIQAEIDVVADAATEQAVALYKNGGVKTVEALLEAQTISELNDRLEMMGVAAEENTDALIDYSRLKAEIQAVNRVLFTKRDELDKRLADQTKLQNQLAASKAELDTKLAAVSEKLVQDKSHEADLLAENAELKATILQAQAPPGVTITGPSVAGYIWPLNNAVTSGYGPRWGRMHTGIDIDGTTGEPIVASKSGTVIQAGSMSGYGNAVVIDHGGGVSTLYAHMSSIAVSGGSISQGQHVGNVGCTGSCTGDHLHFEVRLNGSPTDPMQYLP
jgi:murein DD-endopeptidase MepM/ murein hydrolase activator NlpD